MPSVSFPNFPPATLPPHWYGMLLGMPDEIPADNMAEWQIAADGWLQLDGNDANTAGATTVIIGA